MPNLCWKIKNIEFLGASILHSTEDKVFKRHGKISCAIILSNAAKEILSNNWKMSMISLYWVLTDVDDPWIQTKSFLPKLIDKTHETHVRWKNFNYQNAIEYPKKSFYALEDSSNTTSNFLTGVSRWFLFTPYTTIFGVKWFPCKWSHFKPFNEWICLKSWTKRLLFKVS